jgi:sialidase-1
MAVAGKQVFANGSATGHNSMAKIVSNDNGESWDAPEDVTSQFMIAENSLFPKAYTMFFGSGRMLQSRVYKAEGAAYYRIYGALLIKHPSDTYTGNCNYVVYSDDFGSTWKILGGSIEAGMCCNGGDEPKVEELPDGSIVLSSRKGGGRYFNVFSYGTGENDKANGVGTWNGTANSSFGASDCNGELLRVGNILFQSIPKRGYQGKDRSNVAIFYKVLDPEKDYTASEIATGWQELTQVSFIGSAYSTMTLLPDGKTVGFLYEEDPDNGTFAYCIVYKPIDLTKLLTAEAQKEAFVVNSTIGQYEIGTFYANDAMVVPEGVTAYVATAEPEMNGEDAQGNATGTITMTKVEDRIIPAHTGAVIRGAQGTYSFKLADTAGETVVTKNLMPGYAGIYEHKDVVLAEGYTTYVLTVKDGAAGFYKKDRDFKVYNNKAYLQVPASLSAQALRIRIEDDYTTEIVMPVANGQQPTAIYDLTGRRVQKVQKGLYIVNGKKVWK